jgi:hypothetical protein
MAEYAIRHVYQIEGPGDRVNVGRRAFRKEEFASTLRRRDRRRICRSMPIGSVELYSIL